MPSESRANDKDDRGVKFGTGVGYDDAYGGGEATEYVDSIDVGNGVRDREEAEAFDEGRASNHPSTLQVANAKNGNVSDSLVYFCSSSCLTSKTSSLLSFATNTIFASVHQFPTGK